MSETSTLKKNILLAVGIIGLLVFTSALPVNNFLCKNILIIIGASFLAVSSYLEKEYFFASLECVAIINALLLLFHVAVYLNTVILIVLVLLIAFLIFQKQKITAQLIIGFAGLIFLCLGIIFIQNIYSGGYGNGKKAICRQRVQRQWRNNKIQPGLGYRSKG